MPTNLWDFLQAAPLPHVANVIPFFDGCDRTVIQIPAGITCQDVLSCIDCTYIASLFISTSGSLTFDPATCSIDVSKHRVNDVILINRDCNTYLLSIGNAQARQIVDLNCIFTNVFFSFSDGSNSQIVNNHDNVLVNGRDGLGFRIGNGGLNISLPNPRQHGQVLTWNANTGQAYWANCLDACCDWVYGCMEPIIASLQNQINILAQQLCPCTTGSGTGAYIDIYDEGALVHANVSQLNFVGDCVTAVRNAFTNQADITINCGISGINIFDEGFLVHSAVTNINFIGDCLAATWNAMTNTIDVTLAITGSFDCTQGPSGWDLILTLCGTQIDFGCLSELVRQLSVAEEGTVVDAHTTDINFIGDCVTASPGGMPGEVDVTFAPTLTRGGCTGPTAYMLAVCGSAPVDLSCLAGGGSLFVDNTVFVMKNGNDATGTLERFDLPFLTIQAAIDAANLDHQQTNNNRNVIVYNGRYTERIELKKGVDVDFRKGCTFFGIDVIDTGVQSKVIGNASIEVQTLMSVNPWEVTAVNIQSQAYECEIEVDVDRIYSNGGSAVGIIYILRNEGMGSRLRAIVGSLAQNTCLSNVVLFTANNTGAIDAKIHMWNEIAPSHQFFNVIGASELYRHHSNIVSVDGTQMVPITNVCSDQRSRVYVDNVYIMGCYTLPCSGTTRWRAVDEGIININDLLMDMDDKFATPGAANKVFGAVATAGVPGGEINFYGMSQVYGSVAWTVCLNPGAISGCNIFGRLLTNLTVDLASLDYYLFNGLANYQVEVTKPVFVRMPAYTGYSFG